MLIKPRYTDRHLELLHKRDLDDHELAEYYGYDPFAWFLVPFQTACAALSAIGIVVVLGRSLLGY